METVPTREQGIFYLISAILASLFCLFSDYAVVVDYQQSSDFWYSNLTFDSNLTFGYDSIIIAIIVAAHESNFEILRYFISILLPACYFSYILLIP